MFALLSRVGLLFSIVLITGCSRKSRKQPVFFDASRTQMRSLQEGSQEQATENVKPETKNSLALAQAVQEYEARSADIFIPLQATPVGFDDLQAGQVTVQYSSYLGQQELVASCLLDMERMGWDCKAEFKGDEWLLVFEKPRKICVITFKTVTSAWGKDRQYISIHIQANIR